MNDLKGRFYNCVAKSLAFQFCTARSQLRRTREGDAWILLYRRRRMGRVVPDKDHAGMWRSVKVTNVGFGGALLRIEA